MKKILFYLSLIFQPNWWITLDEYDSTWDELLNTLMKHHDFVPIYIISNKVYIAKLGDVKVWIPNYPYGSFSPYNENNVLMNIRPSRYTIYKARKKYWKDLQKGNLKMISDMYIKLNKNEKI